MLRSLQTPQMLTSTAMTNCIFYFSVKACHFNPLHRKELVNQTQPFVDEDDNFLRYN